MSLPATSVARPALPDLIAAALGLLLFSVLTFFAVAQHLTFHTRARDMGIYVQILWNAAQGRPFVSSLLEENTNHLAEHVAPALWPLVPLAGLAPDAVPLLVIQQALLAACGVPVYLVARARVGRWPALVVLLGFCFMPALSRVSLSEFHPIKLAALPAAAGVAFMLGGRPRSGAVLLLWSLLFEEETAPTVAGAGAMLLAMGLARWVGARYVGNSPSAGTPRDDGPARGQGELNGAPTLPLAATLMLVAGLWTLLVVQVVMPAFRLPAGRGKPTGNRTLSHYEQVQQDPSIVWRWVVGERGPDVLSWLVLPHGGVALLAPEVLLAMLPGFIVLFLQDRPGTYAGHWSAPLLPLVWLAVAVALGRLRRPLVRSPTLPGALALLLAGTAVAYGLDSYFPGGREYEADHYYSTELETDLRRAVDVVPAGASFGGTRRVVPHVAARRELYQFPFTFYEARLRPDSQKLEYYILDLTDSPSRREIEPAESDNVLEKKPRYHVRRVGPSVLLLSKARPEPLVTRGETFGGLVRLVGVEWLDGRGGASAQPAPRAGSGEVGLRLYWETVARSPSDATRVLWLVGPGGTAGPEIAGQPLDEYLPLRDWERGQIVAEEPRLGVDAVAGGGAYRVMVGWRGTDGRPLALDGSGATELELARFERR